MAVGELFIKRNKGEQNRSRQELDVLLEGLNRTKIQINQAYLGFNSVADPDLIESYVYEIQSLQARYSYLLRRVKEMDTALRCTG